MDTIDIDRRRFLRGSAAVAGATLLCSGRPVAAMAAEQKTMTLYSGQHSNTTTALVNAFTKATGIKVERYAEAKARNSPTRSSKKVNVRRPTCFTLRRVRR